MRRKQRGSATLVGATIALIGALAAALTVLLGFCEH
jgi:hypothetical protein